MTTPGQMELPHDHDGRIKQARDRALWELGDEAWADMILAAYMNPEADAESLEVARG